MPPTSQQKAAKEIPIRDFIFAELVRRDREVPGEVIQKGRKVLEELGKFGINRSLSSILVERKLIERSKEKEILREIAKLHVSCVTCRQGLSLADLNADGHLRCDRCQSLLSVEKAEGKSPQTEKGRIEEGLKCVVLESGKVGHDQAGKKGGPNPSAPPLQGRGTGLQGMRNPQAEKGPKSKDEEVAEESKAVKPRIMARLSVKKFFIETVISSGPFGRLYRAHDPCGKGEPVALKILAFDQFPTARTLGALDAEFKAWGRLEGMSPGPYSVVEEERACYIVRPFLDETSVSLADLKLEGIEEPHQLLRGIASRMKDVHKAGLIHGNLKPSNIFLSRESKDSITILDPALHILHPRNEPLVRWKILADSPRYRSPEEIAGEKPTPAADVYALGWIFYTVLAGAPPFQGIPAPEILKRHREGPCPELPPEAGAWKKLHASMTALDPKERPPDAGAVLDRVEEILSGKKPDLPPVTSRSIQSEVAENRRRRKRSRWLVHYVGGPVLLACALTWVGWSLSIWEKARAEFTDKNRTAKLYHGVAEESFQETSEKAKLNPESGRELWDRFLRSFADTPLRGAAEAEKRNYPAPGPPTLKR